MPLPTDEKLIALSQDLIKEFDTIFGLHPGFRPAHARGIMLTGTFSPDPGAASLTRAPHIARESTPVTVRFSNSTGIPLLPDNDPNANPRGSPSGLISLNTFTPISSAILQTVSQPETGKSFSSSYALSPRAIHRNLRLRPLKRFWAPIRQHSHSSKRPSQVQPALPKNRISVFQPCALPTAMASAVTGAIGSCRTRVSNIWMTPLPRPKMQITFSTS